MSDSMNLSEELKKHGLRKTSFRLELLALFQEITSSLSAEEVKNRIAGKTDKVTVYRALDAFEKSGLIHRVPGKGNVTRYALCQTECGSDNHLHNHAHLICNVCTDTFCIEDVEMPVIKETNGFNIQSSKLILEGECPDCQK